MCVECGLQGEEASWIFNIPVDHRRAVIRQLSEGQRQGVPRRGV